MDDVSRFTSASMVQRTLLQLRRNARELSSRKSKEDAMAYDSRCDLDSFRFLIARHHHRRRRAFLTGEMAKLVGRTTFFHLDN